ncbi:MAG: hypothetical protein HY369_01375 [Candidatus Aenigmarchaeota archaeon]|nr:hypothetical protein [Candidatus Aenigmarchaeota archaeon]
MPSDHIVRGLINPLLSTTGIVTSAGIVLEDGRILYAIFDAHGSRVMIVAHPKRTSEEAMRAVSLSPWTSQRPPCEGDLLDELIDPKNADTVLRALELLQIGQL